MRDHDAAEHVCAFIALAPRLQAAEAAGDYSKILELMVYAREYGEAIRSHAVSKLQPVAAVERPMVTAYFKGQF